VLKYAQNSERYPQSESIFLFLCAKKGAVAPVEQLSTFATAPFLFLEEF
jgi:hypothetical protein